MTGTGTTRTRMHTCTYFDDGGFDHLCACGSRALPLVEEDGMEPVLAVLADDPRVAPEAAERLSREYAISA